MWQIAFMLILTCASIVASWKSLGNRISIKWLLPIHVALLCLSFVLLYLQFKQGIKLKGMNTNTLIYTLCFTSGLICFGLNSNYRAIVANYLWVYPTTIVASVLLFFTQLRLMLIWWTPMFFTTADVIPINLDYELRREHTFMHPAQHFLYERKWGLFEVQNGRSLVVPHCLKSNDEINQVLTKDTLYLTYQFKRASTTECDTFQKLALSSIK